MPNPLLIPSPLNRILGAISTPSFPTLNVVAEYLGTDGISVSYNSNFVTQLPGMVSTVNSEEPYVMATVTFSLMKSLALASAWISQAQNTSIIGNIIVKPDTTQYPDVQIYNAAIVSIGDVAMNGMQAAFPVTLSGFYLINSDLWVPGA